MSARGFAQYVIDDWYHARDPGIAAQSWSAVWHYRTFGWREGRQPNPHFDPAYYRLECGAHQPSGDPLADYICRGEEAGRRPTALFDPGWYRQAYQLPDRQNALAHFLRNRRSGEVSPSAEFDTRFYLQTYADVRSAGLDALEHYVTVGRLEGRLPRREYDLLADSGLFDPTFYLFYYEDVRKADVDPLDHFLHSTHERRKPNFYFNPIYYIERTQPPTHYTPLTHYLLIGEALGKAPGPYFDPVWYRQTYRLPPRISALAHYLAHRKTQRFAPNRAFDVADYVQRAGATLRPERDPFMHYLAVTALRP